MSSEVSAPKKKMKKKKKLPKNGEVDEDFSPDVEDSNTQTPPNKSKKKKKPKKKSSRSETGLASDNERSTQKMKKVSQIDDDFDQDNAIKYEDGINEHSSNHNAPRRKKERTKRSSSQEVMDESENIHYRNNYENEQNQYEYDERGRNNSQLPHMQSHDDKGYIEYDQNDYMSEMGNMDPIDDYDQDQDYDLSEDEEEEPRFKYSTAELADGGFRDTNCCLIAAGVFFIVIAILGSVLMSRLQNTDNRRMLSPIQYVRGATLSLPQ